MFYAKGKRNSAAFSSKSIINCFDKPLKGTSDERGGRTIDQTAIKIIYYTHSVLWMAIWGSPSPSSCQQNSNTDTVEMGHTETDRSLRRNLVPQRRPSEPTVWRKTTIQSEGVSL